MSYDHPQSTDVINRLARIEGHVKAVRKMAEEGKPCSDILHQIAAIEAALRKAASIVLDDHLEHCINEGASSEQIKTLLGDLKAVISTYMR
ncbi:MAG: metal-sensitive transcriptional regulator [Bacillota bacterium]